MLTTKLGKIPFCVFLEDSGAMELMFCIHVCSERKVCLHAISSTRIKRFLYLTLC